MLNSNKAMQKFIRIFGLLFFIFSLGACVKDDIPTFGQKIHNNWQLNTQRSFLFLGDDILDTILVDDLDEGIIHLLEIGTDDSINRFIGTPLIDPADGSIIYDTLDFERVAWERKADNELVLGEDILEVYYLEHSQMVLKQYLNDYDDLMYPFKRIEFEYTPFVEPDPATLDTLDVN